MSTLPYATTQTNLTRDLMRLEHDLLERLEGREALEEIVLEEQRAWDEPNLVRRVIAVRKVKVRMGLTSEAADGLVRVELTSGSRANWHFYYLKEGGFSTPPFEDSWIEPLGGEDA